MHGYMVWNNQFKCLGPMKWYDEFKPGDNSGYMYSSEVENPKMPDVRQTCLEEGKVFKHRTLWLSKDDPEKAKKLFEQDFIDDCNEKMEKAKSQLEKRIGILYC